MKLAITKVTMTPNPVEAKKTLKIAVVVKEITPEPAMFRLPFVLGTEKGGIK